MKTFEQLTPEEKERVINKNRLEMLNFLVEDASIFYDNKTPIGEKIREADKMNKTTPWFFGETLWKIGEKEICELADKNLPMFFLEKGESCMTIPEE
jgi:hypothetical protein